MKAITILFFLMLMMTETFLAQEAPPVEAGVSQTLAKWRAANYSDVRYKLNLTLEKGAPLMRGEIEIRVKLTEEGAKNDLILDWRTTQFANDKDKPSADVVAVNDASEILYSMPNEHIRIPKALLKTGENFIKIKFASPIKTSGAAVTRYVDKEDGAEYIYSLFVPSDASTAFPVFDQPDLKARFSLTLTMPEGWKAVSNTNSTTEPRKTEFGGKKIRTLNLVNFEETKPISTYVFAFAAGDFAEVSEPSAVADSLTRPSENSNKNKADSINLNVSNSNLKPSATADGSDLLTKIYVRKSQAEKFKAHSAEVFRLNREGIKFLESYFNYKFPFPKYDLVLIPEFPFGGMEHAGATFLREASIIFPSEPTKNDYVSRANLIFHEAAHQWFGDTVTMKWFDDLWLKEGFAEFMAYKTLEKVMPEYNAWKIFYERNKQAAYLTDSTKGTTPIYQEIPNLSAAKSAYGNIVYRKAPSFLKQAEFYLGEKDFQTAVRAFLKKHEFSNASWQDLVSEFAEVKVAETQKGEYYQKLSDSDKVELKNFTKWSVEREWAEFWVEKRGTAVYRISPEIFEDDDPNMQWNFASHGAHTRMNELFSQRTNSEENYNWLQDVKILKVFKDGLRKEERREIGYRKYATLLDFERKNFEERRKLDQNTKNEAEPPENLESFELTEQGNKTIEEYHQEKQQKSKILYVFPNYQDYGYGIFLLDEKSRAYVLENIQSEKDDFLRTMMWGSLWDSVREAELAPKDYVELVIKNFSSELRLKARNTGASTSGTRNETRITPEGVTLNGETDESTIQTLLGRVGTAMNYYLPDTQRNAFAPRLEKVLEERIANAKTPGQRITFYRAYLNLASSASAANNLKDILAGKSKIAVFQLKTKDKFDIVTRLLILGDKDAPALLAGLEKTETSDEAKRYAYAARAGIGSADTKAKYFKDFLTDKNLSESWIEAAFVPFNSVRHSDLTSVYLETALSELPNLKRNRKIFFINGWLGAFIGGQRSEDSLAIVNKFLADNPNLDKDLRLKILENADGLERAVKIRAKFGK